MFKTKQNKDRTLDKRIENADKFDVDVEYGLSDEQIQSRINNGLTNKSSKRVTKSYWQIFVDNFINFFNIVLFIIAAVMIYAQIEFISFLFLIILFFNIFIGLVQDIRARRLVDKLHVVTTSKVKVIRNGNIQEIQSDDIVLSEIMLINQGDQIVADGEIVSGSVEVDESLLTGESRDIKKEAGSSVLSGSFVTVGHAKIIVKSVGRSNYAEKLQDKAKQFKRPKSEILISIRKVFRVIGFFVVILGIMLIVTYIIKGKFKLNPDGTMMGSEFQETVRSVAGSLVSMIPTGMYLLTSSTLAVGVIRLAKKRMLVQELYCIENLARVDTLCLDKTGTITDGTMTLDNVISLDKLNKDEIGDILYTLEKATGDINSTANAFLKAFKDNNLLDFHSFIPFSSKRKYSAVMLKDGRTFVLGAKEFVGINTSLINDKTLKFEQEGKRVLVLSSYNKAITDEIKLSGLKPEAILVLEDNIKDDAKANIEWFKNNGVTTKIISGDNALSVSRIAEKVGVKNADKYISLDGVSLEEVKKIANDYTVFGRVNPEQKEALVSAMREAGHVVAMTGDGVNDILALRSADCSIAMASGSQAAKNSAHLVTLDSNFSSLPAVVAEGRRVINNLQRTCSLFLVKTFFAMIMTSVFFVIGWINPDYTYPYLTNHLYVWELLTIGMASFFLAFQPNNERLQNSFFQNILKNSLPGGILQIVTASTFLIMHSVMPDFSLETTIAMSVIAFTITSYAILIRICLPFDKYRIVLVSAIAVLISGLFIMDYFNAFSALLRNGSTGSEIHLFKIEYSTINETNWWYIPTVCFGAIGIYLLCCHFINNYLHKKDMKKNENIG